MGSEIRVQSCKRGRPLVAALLVLGALPACTKTPSSQPAARSAPAQPRESRALTLIDPAAPSWSYEEAVAKFADASQRLAAALRLVALAEPGALCVAEPWTDERLQLLRVTPLDDARFALGYALHEDPRQLRAPLVVATSGEVSRLVEADAEEWSVLYVSADAEVFPHVIVTPEYVAVLEAHAEPAITLKRGDAVRFQYAESFGTPYVALQFRGGEGPAAEAARYAWDPYDLMFVGPAADAYPGGAAEDPAAPGFELDIAASKRLLPRGGRIPKRDPEPNVEPDPTTQPQGPADHWIGDPA